MSQHSSLQEHRLILQLLDERRELAGALLRESEALAEADNGVGIYEASEPSVAGELAICCDSELRLLELRELHLQQTERALERLREGSYGVCRSCGEPIGSRRLEALPVASLCLRCLMTSETVGVLSA